MPLEPAPSLELYIADTYEGIAPIPIFSKGYLHLQTGTYIYCRYKYLAIYPYLYKSEYLGTNLYIHVHV